MKAAGWILLAALLIAPAGAQIDAEQNTLYANRGDDWYIATEQVESSSSGNVGISPVTPQERVMPMQPPPQADFELDPDGTVVFVAYYTGSASVSGVPVVLAGAIDVYVELRQGSTVIASGTAEQVAVTGPMVAEARIEVQPEVTEVDATAGNLEWYMEETGAASGALFLPDNGEGEWSRIELPTVGEAGPTDLGVEYQELTGDTVDLSHKYDTSTNRTVQYNWTYGLDQSRVAYDVAVEGGSVAMTIIDADGAHVIDDTFDADDSGTIDVPDATHGPWVILLDFQDFIGTLDLSVEAMESEEPTTTTTTGTTSNGGGNGGTTTTEGGGGNGTAPPTTGTDDSPALILPLVLIGLALIAARRR